MKNKLLIVIIVAVILILAVVGVLILSNNDETEKKKGKEENLESENYQIVLRDNGSPRFVEGEIINSKVENNNDVFSALDEIKDMYGFKSAKEEFSIVSTSANLETTYYKLQQKYKNYLVYGHELVVAVDANKKVSSITGNYLPNIDVSIYSSLSKEKGLEKVKEHLGTDIEVLDNDKYIYVTENGIICAYIYTILSNSGYLDVVVDIQTGEIIEKIAKSNFADYEYTGKDAFDIERTITLDEDSGVLGTKYKFYDSKRKITIVDASNVGADMGSQEDVKWFNLIVLLGKLNLSQGPISADMNDSQLVYNGKGTATIPNAISTMYNLGVAYDYYKNVLGRDSYDNKGSEIIANIGVGKNAYKQDEHFNASWMGAYNKFIFGSRNGISMGAALDVVAHEYTHGVIQYTANLQYRDESGALNEGYADIMGSLIEGSNFQLGESIEELRDMTNPNKYNDPAIKDGKYYFPTDEETYNEAWRKEIMKKLEESGNPIEVWTDYDNGGVHTNSGVPNYAAYLMWENGAFASKEEMAKVWYNSLFLLTQTSDFEDCALAVIQSAKTLGLSDDKIAIIEDAFIETKMLAHDYSSLIGNVKCVDSKEPLQNVLVTAIHSKNPYVNYQTYTDENGNYKFEQLPVADYTITFEKAKYEGLEKNVSLLSGSGSGLDVTLKQIDEADYEASEIIFVIDVSYSMETSDPEDIRKQIMINVLSSLDDNASVALVVFTAESKIINNGLSNKKVDKKILITDIFNIANDNGHTDVSGTNGRAGLSTALEMFTTSSEARKYIVFLTDGVDNRDDGPDYDELIEIANGKNVRILTIGLGSDSDLNPEELKRLADKTNGKYYHATLSDDLHKFDKTIFEELN